MEKKQSKHLIGGILCGALTAFGMVTTVISLIGGDNSMRIICDCFNILVLALITFYASAGYKKPHGNLLKYTILIYAASGLASFPLLVAYGGTTSIIAITIETGILCYLAGRLVKVKENIVLMLFLIALEAYVIITGAVLENVTIACATRLIIWLDICAAYFLRYKEHKEAGLADAPKK